MSWKAVVAWACLVACVLAQPSVHVSPSVVQRSGDLISVSWFNLEPVKGLQDIIAVQLNDFATPLSTRLLDNQHGNGLLRLPLVNVRSASYTVVLKRLNLTSLETVVVAQSSPVVFASTHEPTQGHLSLTNQPDEMRLMFVTGSNEVPQVMWGESETLSNGKVMYANGSSNTYRITDMCDAPANDPSNFRDPGLMHDVLMTGLKPNTRYFYRFGHPSLSLFSAIHSFVSSPVPSSSSAVSLVMYGDMGVEPDQPMATYVSENIIQQLKTQPVNAVVHIGDISYARGRALLWETFMNEISPIATQVPYMVSIGNHEYCWPGQPFKPSWSNYNKDSGGECGVPFTQRFHMPHNGLNDVARNTYFSYNLGPVHVLMFSGEHDWTVGSQQWNWMAKDLANVDRKTTPWLLVAGHRPFYTSIGDLSGIPLRQHLQQALEPLLLKYNVDLCLWGHQHVYERSCGVKEGKCTVNFEGNVLKKTAGPEPAKGIVHAVVGMAGHSYQEPWLPQPEWEVYRSAEFGFSRLDVNQTHLHLTFFGHEGAAVRDHFWIQHV